jgi:hypothetical protein
MNEQQIAILRTLAYYDVFRFPLNEFEIYSFGTFHGRRDELQQALQELLLNGYIQSYAGYYLLASASTDSVKMRRENQQRASSCLEKVKKYSQLISFFPFVKCVCISGSYSKGILDEKGDIDYFIITKKGRLWLTRTLLIAYKKIVLLNSRKYFCINYLVDTDTLEIPDKNIFTATEILSLLPMSGQSVYKQFMRQNAWTKAFLPNYPLRDTANVSVNADKKFLSRSFELLFSAKTGDLLEKWSHDITLKRWRRKFSQFGKEEFDLNMRSKKNISKHHPRGFQNRVLKGYHNRLQALTITDQVAVVA